MIKNKQNNVKHPTFRSSALLAGLTHALLFFNGTLIDAKGVPPQETVRLHHFSFVALKRRLQDTDRIDRTTADQIVKLLNLKPGMEVLDLGAGLGLFSFRIAQVLQGTGHVFATDISKKAINYLNNEKVKLNYQNVSPVLVNMVGLDPFYKEHSFDIIFMANVYQHLFHYENYFEELKSSLKEGGRLYILKHARERDFDVDVENDLDQIVKIFKAHKDDFPVYQRLSKESRKYINELKEAKCLPDDFANERLLNEFKQMLQDRFLLIDLKGYYDSKESGKDQTAWINRSKHISLIHWLVDMLNYDEAFNKDRRQDRTLSDLNKRRLEKLNALLLSHIFKRKQWIGTVKHIIDNDGQDVTATMQLSGYHLIKAHQVPGWDYVLEFAKD